MITGYLANLKQELALYPGALQKGLTYLLKTDFSKTALGHQEIDGSKIYAMVSEYETQPKEVRRPEAHSKYFDIQYIAAGQEMIGSGPLSGAGEVTEDKLAEKDVIFYKALARETFHVLTEGMFAVYFPWDVHRPNCNVHETAGTVKKVVVKVAIDELPVK
ncbi:MAG: YhcH/YjgK/YiaL family protein [Pelosinus sp.]|nr:YhcH/YjgK/YiaL family protein [Pelosinus sp.]